MEERLNIKKSGILLKYLAKETTKEENELVSNWIIQSAENKSYFEEIKALWQNEQSGDVNQQYRAVDAWNNVTSRLDDVNNHEAGKLGANKPLNKRQYIHILRIAAIFLVAFGVWQLAKSTNENIVISCNDDPVNHVLPDSSKIWVNKNSSITYSKKFGKKRREIILSGEAFFEVTSNPEIPFLVLAKGVEVKVVGTSFNVKAYGEEPDVEVSVEEGKVLLTKVQKNKNQDTKLYLNAGEKALVKSEDRTIEKSSINNQNYAAWKTRVLKFNKNKMSEVIDVIESVYDVEIEIIDKTFEECELISKFENQSLEEILEILQHVFDIKITRDKEKIIISGKGC